LVSPAVLRCAFCNKPVRAESRPEILVVGQEPAPLRFCSRNCLESYLEIELGKPRRVAARA
jgi:ribosomal protein L24E